MSEIKCFFCLARYYRRFIQDFSKIAALLTRLTQKEVPFVWDWQCEESFNESKACLITSPVLELPSGNGGFTVYSDACGTGLGVF